MLQAFINPLRRLIGRPFVRDRLPGFFCVRIENHSKQNVWLAKSTVGDLHDIVPAGGSLEIRLPVTHKMKFYAYKASDSLMVSGLNFYDQKEFTRESIWIIN